jgi:hypothetical protein
LSTKVKIKLSNMQVKFTLFLKKYDPRHNISLQKNDINVKNLTNEKIFELQKTMSVAA